MQYIIAAKHDIASLLIMGLVVLYILTEKHIFKMTFFMSAHSAFGMAQMVQQFNVAPRQEAVNLFKQFFRRFISNTKERIDLYTISYWPRVNGLPWVGHVGCQKHGVDPKMDFPEWDMDSLPDTDVIIVI